MYNERQQKPNDTNVNLFGQMFGWHLICLFSAIFCPHDAKVWSELC